ncbi:MAG TPA: DUF1501 domain-containing protein [Pirellulales bacterium]|nr:DUF1501 domain-containing protein [Pirellulales bacterium]
MTACHPTNRRVGPNRREVLRAGSLGLLGLGWPQLLQSQARAETPNEASFGRAKSCILLFMWGGPAHQDTWDLKPNAPIEVRGEFKPIPTRVPGIQICEHLPLLAERADRLAIVRSLTHTNVDHTAATHFLLTGQPPPKGGDLSNDWPHVGSVLARLGRGVGPLPPFVSMRPKPHVENDVPRFVEESHGQFAGWLGQSYNPLTIDADPSHAGYHVGDFALPPEISLARLDDRRGLLIKVNEQLRRLEQTSPTMDHYYRRAFDLLSSAAGGSAFKLDEEPDSVRDRYGRHPHGQSVLQARRLIERGVPLVTVYWPSEGIKNVSVYWDTHSRNFVDLKQRLMPPADQAFSALLDDLEVRGLLDETLVVWTGEFGRTPKVGQRNSDAGAGADGRDHWPGCFSAVLAGGGVRGGQVYGASDRYAAYPAADAVAPLDLVATVYHLLGVPAELALEDQQGRPLVVCPGSPIRALLS